MPDVFHSLPPKSTRVKIIELDPRLLVFMMNSWKGVSPWMQVPIFENIPQDIVVLSVFTEWSTTKMLVLATHDSWDEVPDGQLPPRVPGCFAEFKVVPAYLALQGLTEPLKSPDKLGHYWYRKDREQLWEHVQVINLEIEHREGEWYPAILPEQLK